MGTPANIMIHIYLKHSWDWCMYVCMYVCIDLQSRCFKYLENQLCSLDVAWQPIWGNLTAQAWTLLHKVTQLPWRWHWVSIYTVSIIAFQSNVNFFREWGNITLPSSISSQVALIWLSANFSLFKS